MIPSPGLRETPVQYLSDSLAWHRQHHGRFQPYIKLHYSVLHFHLSFYFLAHSFPQQQFNKYATAFVVYASVSETAILVVQRGC